MAHDTVRGVVVIARAGDRVSYEQNPMTYESSPTECTPLGEVCLLWTLIFFLFAPSDLYCITYGLWHHL